jgi:hypothetical protein
MRRAGGDDAAEDALEDVQPAFEKRKADDQTHDYSSSGIRSSGCSCTIAQWDEFWRRKRLLLLLPMKTMMRIQ